MAAVTARDVRGSTRPKRTASRANGKAKAIAPAPSRPGGRHPDFDVEAALRDMPDNFIQCRDYRHAWRPFHVEELRDGGFEQILRCSRCKSKRIRLIGSRGQLVKREYDYTKGYVIKGMGRLTGNELDAMRLESIMRTLAA